MKKILINVGLNLVKICLVENNKLVELIVENKNEPSLIGRIYVGKIKNIFPLKFAFIDINRNENAFLNLLDKKEKLLYENKQLKIKQEDDILVQVIKDETDKKGACVTTQLSIKGKYIVLFKYPSTEQTISLSKKIEDEETRAKLFNFFEKEIPAGYGVIARTSCSDLNYRGIKEEFNKCKETILQIIEKGKHLKGPYLLNEETSIYSKALKDLYSEEVDEIIIDCENEYNNMKENRVENALYLDKLKLYNDEISIFRKYQMEKHLKGLYSRKIWLKSGAYIVIDETEAMVVVDVNSGKYTGKKNFEQTSLKINLEATEEILKQLRLRNLSGIIIIDYIDMELSESKTKLKEKILELAKLDRLTVNYLSLSELGLVTLTRKKEREPISKILGDCCSYCQNERAMSPYEITERIYEEIVTMKKQTIYSDFTVETTKEIVNILEKNIPHFKKQGINLILKTNKRDNKVDKYVISHSNTASCNQ